MSGYQLLALIAISFLLGFGGAWHYKNLEIAAKDDAVQKAAIAQHTKVETAINKIDTVTDTERATYEGKITTLQKQIGAARKADTGKHCVVPLSIVRAINAAQPAN